MQGTTPEESQQVCVCVCSPQLPLKSTVQESNKGGTVAFVEILMDVCMADIPINLTDEFRIFWGIKNPNFSSCIYISLRDSIDAA